MFFVLLQLIKRLQKRQAKLLKFIEEHEPSSPDEDIRAEPIGESCSEESLLSASGYGRKKSRTKSLSQPLLPPTRDTSHRKAINAARAEFFRDLSSQKVGPEPHRKLIHRSGSLPPVMTLTSDKETLPSVTRNRSKSEEKEGMKSLLAKNKTKANKGLGPVKAKSSVAEQVTSRLYNPEKIRQKFENSRQGTKQKETPKVRCSAFFFRNFQCSNKKSKYPMLFHWTHLRFSD